MKEVTLIEALSQVDSSDFSHLGWVLLSNYLPAKFSV